MKIYFTDHDHSNEFRVWKKGDPGDRFEIISDTELDVMFDILQRLGIPMIDWDDVVFYISKEDAKHYLELCRLPEKKKGRPSANQKPQPMGQHIYAKHVVPDGFTTKPVKIPYDQDTIQIHLYQGS